MSLEGLKMDPAKVTTILEWPEPRNVKDIQSFLGFANFYRCFINGYSMMIQPLTQLCRKSMGWQFSEDERRAFELLKASFTEAPVLCHWRPDLPMTVETDALDHTIAAILSVTTLNSEIRPIAFHSQSLHDTEKNYDIHDKELLAIFEAYKIW